MIDETTATVPRARVALRYYRLLARAPYVEVCGEELWLRLPAQFGGRTRWRIPLTEVGVVDASETEGAAAPAVVFLDGVKIPYLVTTGQSTTPNLALVFRQPQRLPRVRLGGVMTLPFWKSHSSEGVWVDGLLLRALDAAQAVEVLVGAGVERVRDSDSWLAETRRASFDPDAIARSVVEERRDRRLQMAGYVASILLLASARTMSDSDLVWVPLGLLGLGWAGVAVRNARKRRRSRDDGR